MLGIIILERFDMAEGILNKAIGEVGYSQTENLMPES